MIPPRLRRCCGRRSLAVHQVFFHDVCLNVTVTKRAAEVDQWIAKTVHDNRHCLYNLVVGLDIEWHPCQPGQDNLAATLQLCVGRSCLIFQLLHRDYIPDSLLAFLADALFAFVGVGVQEDAEKLFRDHGLVVGRVVDLRSLAGRVCGSEGYRWMGLKKMALSIIGRQMDKPLEVACSEWDAPNLTYKQIEYGAIDAFASFQIGMNLFWRAHQHALPIKRDPLLFQALPTVIYAP